VTRSKAAILAAGRGERLWPLAEKNPKHLLPVGGEPLLQRTIRALVQSGVREIVMVVQFEAEKIKNFFKDGRELGCEISYVKQKRLGGTADAVRTSESELRGEDRFLVVYGDNYYDQKALGKFVKSSDSRDLLMGAAEVKDPSRFGSLEIKRGNIVAIHEKVAGGNVGVVNAGIYVLDESVFTAIGKTRKSRRGEFELTDSLSLLMTEGRRIRTIPFGKGEWVGISYPWDLLEANWSALDSDEEVRDGETEVGVHLKGSVSLSKGSLVKSGSYIEGPVYVGEGAVVGPNAYLRPGTSLGKEVKVGASCEVKNSIVMSDAKIPHLCYVGDSILGNGASLGAGTITANLKFNDSNVESKVKGQMVDSGQRKLGAIIGDGAKTGINVSIFPGVKIGTDAWIGPGAIVRADVLSKARVK
jgi:UDP-N-acetylglucosamine diphosphorylase / glucose-1-phosphate thymidylyltransferase / UDP-N-acetylgalactosamine diphosphorylase / glucosamine-1-phosphate N-acetyltransferase / galactosamine-1-phosphate N-acetyltransferase